MRTTRLLLPALLTLLALAAPAIAEDTSVDAPDYEFTPKSASIAVGDTATWNFMGPSEHTATSNPGQPEKFDSGLKGAGGTFAHTFTKPGKYQYFCRPHEDFMKGTITVGTDAVRWVAGAGDGDGVDGLAARFGLPGVHAAQAGLIADLDAVADALYGRA